MDAIAPTIEMVVEQKHTVPDAIMAGLKSAKVAEKSKINAKDSSIEVTDATPFHFCLKESLEQNASQENMLSQDLKTDSENSPEVKEVGNLVKSANDNVFVEAQYMEAVLFQISNAVSADTEESNANGNHTGITNALTREISFVGKLKDVDPISESQNKSGSYPAAANEMDMLHQLDASDVKEANVIQKPAPTEKMEIKDMENQKPEVISSRTNTERINNDFEINNFSPSIDHKVGQSKSLPEEQVSTASDHSPFSQNLNSQSPINEIEQYGRSRLSEKSIEQLQTGGMNTVSDSQTRQTQELNGKIDIKKKEESPVSGNSEQDLDDNMVSHKFDQKEVVRENLLSGPSARKENQNGNQEKRLSQEFDSLLKNSSIDRIEPGQFLSVDNRTWSGKSESKLIQPQVLMDQIVDGGMQVIQKGSGRVRMTLNPPNLGSLDMDIQIRNNKIEVVFVADTPEIQQSLQANSDLLKAALSQQGLKVDGYNVLLQGNMDHNNAYYSGEGALWRDSRRDSSKQGNRKDQQEQPDIIKNLNTEKWSDPTDNYKISLFI